MWSGLALLAALCLAHNTVGQRSSLFDPQLAAQNFIFRQFPSGSPQDGERDKASSDDSAALFNDEQLGNKDNSVVISTLLGPVLGRKFTTEGGADLYKFKGIPYAEAPVGQLRLLPTVPKGPWSGILTAVEDAAVCLQADPQTKTIRGSEDCLYLNVYSPRLPDRRLIIPRELIPVMVWIHGGAFNVGGGSESEYDPSLLVRQGVVVVTINYRLGPLGFLSVPGDPSSSGNLGLWDQLTALEWVRSNIAYFGGNPDKVTIFGESAGAISVHAHLLSAQGDGLYQGAIAQSGNLLVIYQQLAQRLVDKSSVEFIVSKNCSSLQTLFCLQQLPPREFAGHGLTFGPRIDTDSVNPFLAYDPLELLMAGRFKQIPLITGINSDEGAMTLGLIWEDIKSYRTFNETNTTKYLFFVAGSEEGSAELEELYQVARIAGKFYTGYDSYSQYDKDVLLKLFTDSNFASGHWEIVEYHSKGQSPVYSYLLTARCHNTSYSNYFGGNEEDMGVAHGDDIPCLFQVDREKSRQQKVTSGNMIKMWTNFAKFYNPTPFAEIEPRWLPVSPLNRTYMDIGNSLELKSSLWSDRMVFWDRLYWAPIKTKLAERSAAARQQYLLRSLGRP